MPSRSRRGHGSCTRCVRLGTSWQRPGRDIEAPRELDIYAIAIPPVAGAEPPAYEEARAAFAENDVIELTPDGADRVGAQAAEALGACVTARQRDDLQNEAAASMSRGTWRRSPKDETLRNAGLLR